MVENLHIAVLIFGGFILVVVVCVIVYIVCSAMNYWKNLKNLTEPEIPASEIPTDPVIQVDSKSVSAEEEFSLESQKPAIKQITKEILFNRGDKMFVPKKNGRNIPVVVVDKRGGVNVVKYPNGTFHRRNKLMPMRT